MSRTFVENLVQSFRIRKAHDIEHELASYCAYLGQEPAEVLGQLRIIRQDNLGRGLGVVDVYLNRDRPFMEVIERDLSVTVTRMWDRDQPALKGESRD